MRTNAVTILGLDGGEVSTFGGPGEGPGEFSRIGHVLAPTSDSILVSDSGNLRVTWFADGEYALDRRFESMVAEGVYEPVSRTSDGRFILIPSAFALRLDMETGWKEYPILGTRDFATLDTLARLPLMHFRDRDSRNPVSHRGIVFATAGGFAHARTDRLEITWRDATGGVIQILRWAAEPREATEADWADWERTYRSRSSPAGDPEAYEQRIRDMGEDFGGTVPLFTDGHGDDRGNVWLAEQTFAGIGNAFHVLSASGEWIGRVVFPRPIQILDIRGELVRGVERDELDIQGVAVYHIHRSAR